MYPDLVAMLVWTVIGLIGGIVLFHRQRDGRRSYVTRQFAALVLIALLTACGGASTPMPGAEFPGSPVPTFTTPTVPESTTTPTVSPPSPTTASTVDLQDCAVLEPPGRCGKVDIGGYALWIVCRGSGSPTIVLDAGFGGDTRDWNSIIGDVSTISQACVYDRAGLGLSNSPPPSQPSRTSQHIVMDLHTLLTRAGIPGPYVLVGHSFGGENMRLFADVYRAEVSGMVLVDASTPQQEQRFATLRELLPPASADECPILKELRDGSPQDRPEGNSERLDAAASGAVVAATRDLDDMPLVVLTAGKPPEVPACVPQAFVERIYEIWLELQGNLVGLSTNSRQVIATKSRHFIQNDEPELVIEAVRSVVEAARSGSRLDE